MVGEMAPIRDYMAAERGEDLIRLSTARAPAAISVRLRGNFGDGAFSWSGHGILLRGSVERRKWFDCARSPVAYCKRKGVNKIAFSTERDGIPQEPPQNLKRFPLLGLAGRLGELKGGQARDVSRHPGSEIRSLRRRAGT